MQSDEFMYICFEGMASVVPFHGITSPNSYFEEILIFVPIQQGYLGSFSLS